MSAEKKIPEIRFKEFKGEWEKKKIGSVLAEIKRSIELMDNASYQLVTVKRRNEGVVPRAVLKGKNILVKNYFSVKAGDYLISKRQVVHGANGIVPDNLDGAVVSNEYLVITDSDGITARYWTVASTRPEMHKLFFVSSYGVDIEKLVFDVADWKNRTIVIPQVTEQKNITDFFLKLDNLINQHQQMHDKLSNIKEAMLEKMFPKQGETMPEIRFKGFSGEWVCVHLGEICEFMKGQSLNWKDIDSSGKKPCILYGHLYTIYGMSVNKVSYFTNNDNAAIPRSRHGDILIPGSDTTPTGIARATCIELDNVLLGGDINILRPDKNINGKYLSYCINANKKKLIKLIKGTSVKHLVNSDLAGVSLKITTKPEEQIMIGNYFQNLDMLINRHQQQIAKLNNIKQAFLSKMFV